MENQITDQQKRDAEKASQLIGSILSQYHMKLVVQNNLVLLPMDETQTTIPPEAPEVAPENAPTSEVASEVTPDVAPEPAVEAQPESVEPSVEPTV